MTFFLLRKNGEICYKINNFAQIFPLISPVKMKVVLCDLRDVRDRLLPLTYTRPVSELRVGIDTIGDKWRRMIPGEYSWKTADYLQVKYAATDVTVTDDDAMFINGHIVPDDNLALMVRNLKVGQALFTPTQVMVAMRGGKQTADSVVLDAEPQMINHLYDIFLLNGRAIEDDFIRITRGRTSAVPSPTVTIIGPRDRLFIEPDARFVEGCTINTCGGSVYIGRDAEVMEGACLRGPVAVCDGAVVNMGARIYGATTIGPHSKVGGELNNVVIWGYSNKAHDGFLGNAVIGQWCNIGAGATASNLKNDYTPIKLWNYQARRFERTGLQFCGVIMGDHSKLGINTMLNTATVLGVGVNIYGSGFPRPFLASFSEGSPAGYTDVVMSKFFDTARTMMARRGIALSDADIKILETVRRLAENYR